MTSATKLTLLFCEFTAHQKPLTTLSLRIPNIFYQTVLQELFDFTACIFSATVITAIPYRRGSMGRIHVETTSRDMNCQIFRWKLQWASH
jgi:hypothetical protein